MGYDVIQITYEQIKDTKSFNNIAELIHKKAGLPYIPKTDQERYRRRCPAAGAVGQLG